MVRMDHQLICEAQRFITGANIHRLGEMILLYEMAVRLHNTGHPAHLDYENRYERELRKFVHQERITAMSTHQLLFQ